MKKNQSLTHALNLLGRKPKVGPRLFNRIGLTFDHEPYFDAALHPESAFAQAVALTQYVAFAETTQNLPAVYVVGAISGGLRAFDLAKRENAARANSDRSDSIKSLYKLEDHIGVTRFREEIIAPNTTDNLLRGRMAEQLFPHAAIVVPIAAETSNRQAADNIAFSGGVKFEEEGHMARWFPLIQRCSHMMLDGDWNFSRNSVWEMMMGTMLQAGLVRGRPNNKPFEVVGRQGQPHSLLWRAQQLEQSLAYAVLNDFDLREGATAALQLHTIDNMLRKGDKRIDTQQLHPVLAQRSQTELQQTDEVFARLVPLVLNHACAGVPPEGLPASLQRQLQQGAGQNKPVPPALRRQLKKLAEGPDKNPRQHVSVSFGPHEAANALAAPRTPKRRYKAGEQMLAPQSRPLMFDDNHASRLHERDRLAISFAIASTEIADLPLANPMATLVVGDFKRGPVAQAMQRRLKLQDVDDVFPSLGRHAGAMQQQGRTQLMHLKQAVAQQRPGKAILSTHNLRAVTDTLEYFNTGFDEAQQHGRFIAAPGPANTSALARLTFDQALITRTADEVVFEPGWANSPHLLQLRVQARMVQAGLVRRPLGVDASLRVYTGSNLNQPESLLHDVQAVTTALEGAIASDVRKPELALAAIRLVTLHEMRDDPVLSRQLMNPALIEPSLQAYDLSAMDSTLQRTRPLLEKAVGWVARDRLLPAPHPDTTPERKLARSVEEQRMKTYLHAWDKAEAARQKALGQPVSVVRTRSNTQPVM